VSARPWLIARSIQIDLRQVWNEIGSLADSRERQKGSFASTNPWCSLGTHMIGLCGEFGFAMCYGYDVDKELKIKGDSGFDFVTPTGTVDVKTSAYWDSPILKEHPSKPSWPDRYVLASVSTGQRACRLWGWIDRTKLESLPMRDFGNGEMLTARPDHMEQMPKRSRLQIQSGMPIEQGRWR